MNVYEAIRHYLTNSMYNEAGDESRIALGYLLNAYDALAPDGSMWPDWAQWVTIFDNGKLVWWELEPEARIMPNGEYAWTEQEGRMGRARSEQLSPLPLGIDWRLCKWSREVTK